MIIRTGAFYQAFKYSIYAALTINTVYFFIENFAGAAYTYRDGLALTDIIVAYTDAIDTAAWLVLLLLLELGDDPCRRHRGRVAAVEEAVDRDPGDVERDECPKQPMKR